MCAVRMRVQTSYENITTHPSLAGAPLRILGPLDSIFTRALLRGWVIGFPLRTDHLPAESPSVENAIAFSAEPCCTRASNLVQLNRITSPSPTRARLFFPLLPNQIILFQLLKFFSFVCNSKVIIFCFGLL